MKLTLPILILCCLAATARAVQGPPAPDPNAVPEKYRVWRDMKLNTPPIEKLAAANVVQPPASNRVDIVAIKGYWHQPHITTGTNAAGQMTNYVYRLWMKTNLATANKTKLMDIPANGSDDTYYVSLTNTPTAFFFTQNVNLLLP